LEEKKNYFTFIFKLIIIEIENENGKTITTPSKKERKVQAI